MKSDYLDYPWALAYGFYFYVLFQLMFALRFGHLNTVFNTADIGLYLVGVGSVLMCMYFAKKASRQWPLYVGFIIAIPFAYTAALGGGLLGIVSVLIGGLIPFAIFLPLAQLFTGAKAQATPAPTSTPASPSSGMPM